MEETSVSVSLAEALDAVGYRARAGGGGAEDSGVAAGTASAERCPVGFSWGWGCTKLLRRPPLPRLEGKSPPN